MANQEENQGDQANRRQGRLRRSRTKSISDVRGMFADSITSESSQNAENKDIAQASTTRGK